MKTYVLYFIAFCGLQQSQVQEKETRQKEIKNKNKRWQHFGLNTQREF